MLLRLVLVISLFLPPIGDTVAWADGDAGHPGFDLEYLAQGLFLTDWMQTRYIAKHLVGQLEPGAFPYNCNSSTQGCVPIFKTPPLHESNPFLGDHPSLHAVDTYFPSVMFLHYEAAQYLDTKYRIWFEGGSIVAESLIILRNHAIGASFSF